MKRNKRILLVDDDKVFRETRREYLENANYQVIEAGNAKDARSELSSNKVDLAIVDVRLQAIAKYDDWSGLELAREIGSRVPILLMSAYGEKIAEMVRGHLLSEFDKASVAVGFHAKQDGAVAMLSDVDDLLRYPVAGKATPLSGAQQSVFLAYGHHDKAKTAVREFLSHNGLKVLELGRVGQFGDSILGNVDRYINQSHFAVVLFTGDDEGYSLKEGMSRKKRRARQNVVFELGYLLAKLGRRRVRVLVEEDVEIPTNYHGMLYISFDNGLAWQSILARELRLSGINVNLENVIGETKLL